MTPKIPNMCIKLMEDRVIKALSELDPEVCYRKWAIERETGIPMDILTVILKRLRDKGIIELIPIFSEWTLMADGSGYWLKSKNNP